LKDVRQQWSDSRFIFGKNKVIVLALGRGPESEYKPNLCRVSRHLVGNVGVLFTNRDKSEVLEFFDKFSCPDYARSGNVAVEDVTIAAGPLEQFQHTMEPQLRQLGMHTTLKKGIVHLDTDFKICGKGDKLTPEQCRLLKLFDMMQATFKIKVKVFWTKTGHYEIIDNTVEEEAEEDEEEKEADEEEEDDEDVNNNKKKMKKSNEKMDTTETTSTPTKMKKSTSKNNGILKSSNKK